MPGRAAALALALGLLLGGCSNGTDPDRAGIPDECGLPTPDPGADSSLVPPEFLLNGVAELTSAQAERGGFLAALNIPLGVVEGFERYKAAAVAGGFSVISEDNEIVEAEIYLQKDEDVGAIQVRRSVCDDASIVFVNIIAADRNDEIPEFPVPSGARPPTSSPTPP